MFAKGQRVSTANEGGLTSAAAFLFAFVPRLSFHGSFIQEPHAECLEDTRRNVYSFLFFSLSSFPFFCMVEKKDNPLGGEHVTLRIPAVHPWRTSQRPSCFWELSGKARYYDYFLWQTIKLFCTTYLDIKTLIKKCLKIFFKNFAIRRLALKQTQVWRWRFVLLIRNDLSVH